MNFERRMQLEVSTVIDRLSQPCGSSMQSIMLRTTQVGRQPRANRCPPVCGARNRQNPRSRPGNSPKQPWRFSGLRRSNSFQTNLAPMTVVSPYPVQPPLA